MTFGRYVAHIFRRYIFSWGASLKWKDNCVHYMILQHLVLFMYFGSTTPCFVHRWQAMFGRTQVHLLDHRDLEVKGQRMKWTEDIHRVCTGAWQRGKNVVNVCDWNINFAQCGGIHFDHLITWPHNTNTAGRGGRGDWGVLNEETEM